MKIPIYAAIFGLAVGSLAGSALAQNPANAEPGGSAGNWSTRTPVKPDPSKIKLIDYDFAKYGASAERGRLLAKWDAEIKVGAPK